MFGIRHNRIPPRCGSFDFYRTRKAAEEVAASYRKHFPNSLYEVVRVRMTKAEREDRIATGAHARDKA